MATRFNKEAQIANDPGPQRDEQAAVKGQAMKPSIGGFKQVDHSKRPNCGKIPAKGFKDLHKS